MHSRRHARRLLTFPLDPNSLDAKTIDQLHLPGMGTRWRIEFDARLPSNPDQETWKVGIAPGKKIWPLT